MGRLLRAMLEPRPTTVPGLWILFIIQPREKSCPAAMQPLPSRPPLVTAPAPAKLSRKPAGCGVCGGGRPMAPAPPDTDVLLDRAQSGDGGARSALMARHRDRLRRMVALRLDPRLAARVDPSD